MNNLPDFFGLNLGHSNTKLAQLKILNGGTRASVVALASSNLTSGLIDQSSDQAIETLGKEIAGAHKKSGIRTNNCVLAVPEYQIFSRLMSLPKVADAEVQDTIHWAIKPLLPVAIEDVNISFLPINEGRNANGEFVNWYVVAAPKILVSRLQNVIEKAGLTLLAVETESLALARLVSFNFVKEREMDSMIIDLGFLNTNMILIRNSTVMFSQTVNTGSEAITKVISADYGIDEAKAEKYKLAYGLDAQAGEGKIAKSIEPIIQILVGEINRTVSYYNEKIGGTGIARLYLTGGGASLPKLDAYLATNLKIETLVLDTLPNIEVSSAFSPDSSRIGLRSFGVALGLALKTY